MTPLEIKEAYRRKLATNPDGELALDTVQISHPNLTKTYHLVADKDPLVAYLENGQQVTFEPAAIKADNGGNNNDMDQQAKFTIADPDNLLDDEMARIPLESDTLPEFTFRTYLRSDLSYPAYGPITYDTQTISQKKGVFTASVGLPRLNQKGTGLIATPTDIPILRGLLG